MKRLLGLSFIFIFILTGLLILKSYPYHNKVYTIDGGYYSLERIISDQSYLLNKTLAERISLNKRVEDLEIKNNQLIIDNLKLRTKVNDLIEAQLFQQFVQVQISPKGK